MTLETTGLEVAGRLHDLSISLQLGEVTAICGPNGAGKSTLLSCLAGLLTPDAGEVRMGRQAMQRIDRRSRARTIGYLPQSGEAVWDVSVEVLVSLGRLPWQGAPAPEAHAAIEEAIAAMDLQDLRHRPVSRLSGGERARALMARVLATRPGWLLADEPLANLDLAHAAGLIQRLRQQAEAGRGVVLVLHDLAAAMNHADRVIVLDKGRLAADGAPEFALDAATIERVWQCRTEWLGDPGTRALSVL
jgi:ABC-type cobalamin/Fe3+-siderophores transport systems, ATPase components